MTMHTITATEAAHRQADGVLILDVRNDDEWVAGHILGARHIPLDQLADRRSELPGGEPIIAVCRSGARSERAAQHLIEHGFDVTNLTGGTMGWHQAGLPLDPPDGHVA
jgi:rhodanese-related sulfurtransferase